MGILKSAADLVYTIRFLKLLVTPFEKTDAFEAGIIDADGKKNKEFTLNDMDDRDAYRSYYTPFHRLVFNLKKIMAKVPGGSSVVARYGAALALIKEHGELSDANVDRIHAKTGIDLLDCLAEESQWFMTEGHSISPGMYKMKNESLTDKVDEIISKGDQIRITTTDPIDEVLGLPIYEAIHVRSNQRLLVTTSEITK
jgi:hypothetical protein|tara:strand:+ start:1946 stop:2539 length:594 start_codon:yes stop_codon:yes gene_type:complete